MGPLGPNTNVSLSDINLNTPDPGMTLSPRPEEASPEMKDLLNKIGIKIKQPPQSDANSEHSSAKDSDNEEDEEDESDGDKK